MQCNEGVVVVVVVIVVGVVVVLSEWVERLQYRSRIGAKRKVEPQAQHVFIVHSNNLNQIFP